ncbi:YybH family protein [Ruegeria sp. MALMAid1280]|uniref:YybH family protein n=1 Tax=Ruegeria sp. MALMAid1280 TaxID=3411634 RepID=UPI003B9E8EAD
MVSAVVTIAVVFWFIANESAADQTNEMLGPDKLSDSNRATLRELILSLTNDLVAKEYDAWENYWAADATLMPAGSPYVTGRENVLAYDKNFGMSPDYAFEASAFAGQGDLAVVSNRIVLKGGERDGASIASLRAIRLKSGLWSPKRQMLRCARMAGSPITFAIRYMGRRRLQTEHVCAENCYQERLPGC